MTKDKNPEPNDPDDLWLQALRGAQINFRLGSDLKNNESYLKVKEAEILRKKILYKIENENKFETSSSAYQKILDEAKSRKLLKGSKKTWNWFGLTDRSGFSISGGVLVTPTYAMASVVLIVGLVAIAGYQAIELKEMAAQSKSAEILRGGDDKTTEDTESKRPFQHEVSLKSPTPLITLQSIIAAGLDADVVIESRKIDSGYQILISGLKSMDKRQVTLKAIIGLSNQVNGSVKVVILEK